jgi:integrase
MAKRRGDGEGSIYETQDGRWRAEVSLGYKPDGKARRKILYGKTRAEVSGNLKRVLRDQQIGVNISPERQTLAAFLTSWLEQTVRRKNRVQTAKSYEWIIRVHLSPGLGKLTLDKLTPLRLQTFLNEKFESGLSAGTVKHIRATLRAALSQAHRWQMVHQNAAKLVSIPSGAKYVPKVFTPDEARAFLKAIAGHRLEGLFTVAVSMGLRRGELLGLRWQDLDLIAGSLEVRHALQRVKGKGLQLASLKSEKARRGLRIPQVAIRALSHHRLTQNAERQWAGSGWVENDFVFTTPRGTPLIPESANEHFAAILKSAELPSIRFHDLRHSCATLLLSLGVHPKLVQETLGHSTFQLTMDTYSHMIPALRNEVADKTDELFGISVSTPTKSPTKPETLAVQ